MQMLIVFGSHWRLIGDHPVVDYPLVLCNTSTMGPESCQQVTFVPAGEVEKATSAFYTLYNSELEFWYLERMGREWLALFKQHDSWPSKAQAVFYCSVRLDNIPKGSPPRESWECRVMVFHFAPECRDERRRVLEI
jgi:hypothetical protein